MSDETKQGPHVLDFDGVQIRPGLYAIEEAELQRIGTAAYQAGCGERDAAASYSRGFEHGRRDVERLTALFDAESKRTQQLREALDLASKQQARVAAFLGCEPGEDVGDEALFIADTLRKTCDRLGIDYDTAEDVPATVWRHGEIVNAVTKALGFEAARDAASFERAFAERLAREADDTERKVRKSVADQLNAGQACINRVCAERERSEGVLRKRIAEVEAQRDEARAAHHTCLENGIRLAEAWVKLSEELGCSPADAPAMVKTLRAQRDGAREDRRTLEEQVIELRAGLRAQQMAATPQPLTRTVGPFPVRAGEVVITLEGKTLPPTTFGVGQR